MCADPCNPPDCQQVDKPPFPHPTTAKPPNPHNRTLHTTTSQALTPQPPTQPIPMQYRLVPHTVAVVLVAVVHCRQLDLLAGVPHARHFQLFADATVHHPRSQWTSLPCPAPRTHTHTHTSTPAKPLYSHRWLWCRYLLCTRHSWSC